MLRFTKTNLGSFKRGCMILCSDALREFVAIPNDCEVIWIEFNDQPAAHRFQGRLLTDQQWMSDTESGYLRVDGRSVHPNADTQDYIERKFGNKTFYFTVWY